MMGVGVVSSILLGVLLDFCFGDPYWLPHPVVWMGKGISAAEKQALLAVLRLLAAGNDAAMAACDRLEALWSDPQPPRPENKTTARLSLAVLGRMILGRS